MCKSTKQNRAADSRRRVAGIEPNGAGGPGGGGGPAPEPANAFHGIPEGVPEIVFIRERPGDGFLTSARTYYEFFGLEVHMVNSIDEILEFLSQQAGTVYRRILIVSHAHPRGMIIPFFTNGVRGTNKEIFTAFAESDLQGLRLLSPFESGINHLFNWNSIMSQLMGAVRARPNAATVLTPFNLQTSGSPSGDLREYFKYCFDIVYMRNPGRVKRNTTQAGGLTSGQRTILENFVGAILNALKPPIMASTAGVTEPQLQALKTLITGMAYGDLAGVVDAHPDLGLTDDSMNDFPTLQVIPAALQNGAFRNRLTGARQRFNAQSIIDIRGCRAGDDPDYLEALRTFFGTGAQKPTCTAPRWFQSYPHVAFERPASRANIQSLIAGGHWGHTENQFKEAFRAWADLLRVTPLHKDFWLALLRGQAIRFCALAWITDIPALFIPTPGLGQLSGKTTAQVIGLAKDYFNVPGASVPNASTLTGLAALFTALPGYNQSLLAEANASTTPARLQELYENLRQINNDLGQSAVPATQPAGLTFNNILQYQQALITFLENTRLTPVKTFMAAAADSLDTGDGLFYYLLFAGLPVFVFGTPELSKNGLVMLDSLRGEAIQSWYKCLWKDPLPASAGAYRTANLTQGVARTVAALVGEDRTSYLSICPMPRYNHCIRKRPLPPGEDESLC